VVPLIFSIKSRHHRAGPGDPRLPGTPIQQVAKTWMAGSSPAMTAGGISKHCIDPLGLQRNGEPDSRGTSPTVTSKEGQE
jgi:hypothetical protein